MNFILRFPQKAFEQTRVMSKAELGHLTLQKTHYCVDTGWSDIGCKETRERAGLIHQLGEDGV